jgi:hypothetical protein
VFCCSVAFHSILKGSEDGVMHFEESCFWTLSIIQCFFFKNDVSETDSCFHLRVKTIGEGVAPTLWGPLERASLNHWTPSHQRTCRRKQNQFPKRCF